MKPTKQSRHRRAVARSEGGSDSTITRPIKVSADDVIAMACATRSEGVPPEFMNMRGWAEYLNRSKCQTGLILRSLVESKKAIRKTFRVPYVNGHVHAMPHWALIDPNGDVYDPRPG